MQSSSASSFTDALSAEEVCPLCLDCYTAADECTCVVCRAPSCPSCAETVDADGAMRCFACRPVQLGAEPGAIAARQTLSLPRPIALSACTPELAARVQSQPPPLPFPLTTSPQGVRSLKPRPTGSVFVGLPSVPAQLNETLRAGNTPAAPRDQPRVLRGRAQLTALQRNVRRELAQWSQQGLQAWRAWQPRLPSLVRSFDAWFRSGLASSLAQLKRLNQSRLGKPLAGVSERLSRAHALSEGSMTAAQSDHSRPISL